MPAIHQLLRTKNRKEQEAIVAGLLNWVSSPVVTIVVHYDGRTGNTSVEFAGDRVQAEMAIEILKGAEMAILKLQVEAQQRENGNGEKGASEPSPPSQP